MNETIQCISQRNHLFIPAIYIWFLSILFLMPRCCTYHTRLFIVTKFRSCYFWGLFLWYMCLNTLVSKLWVAQWEGWLLPGERETLRVVVGCWEAPRLLRRSTGPTSHDTPCVPCRFPSGQCRVCGLPICICKSMTSKGNKWSIFARQVSPLFILCSRFYIFHCMQNISKQTLSWHPMCGLQLSFWPMQPFFFLRN